jgi:hypothetical protein
MATNEAAQIDIPEQIDPEKRLGRHILHDSRSWNYQAQQAPKVKSVSHAAVGLPLNQGQLGSCTANALCGAMNSKPDFTSGSPLNEKNAVDLYNLETQLEGKPHPPNDPGGSGLMVCKAAMQQGLIASYTHAFGIQQALEALTLRPVITGINWYTSFDTPSSDGLVAITPEATVRGGHEVVADGIDAANELVWFWNSWGTQYGVGGRFCMNFDTWEQLLTQQGDVTVPVK